MQQRCPHLHKPRDETVVLTVETHHRETRKKAGAGRGRKIIQQNKPRNGRGLPAGTGDGGIAGEPHALCIFSKGLKDKALREWDEIKRAIAGVRNLTEHPNNIFLELTIRPAKD